jgi:tRNA dimethylallyltransferase
MTAKPSPADLERVKHHLYEIIDMEKVTDFNVQKYQTLALAVLDDIHSRGKLPIVVGGTNYYIESLLFEDLAQPPKMLDPHSSLELEMMYTEQFADFKLQWPDYEEAIVDFEENIPPDTKDKIELKYQTPEDVKYLHGLLKCVDPPMAEYLHSNDKRRIVNAIFKFFKMNIIAKQRKDKEQGKTAAQIDYLEQKLKLRFLPILVQIKADEEVITSRIRNRINKMIYDEKGLSECFDVFGKLGG